MNLTLYVPDSEADLIRRARLSLLGSGSSLSKFVLEELQRKFQQSTDGKKKKKDTQ